MSFSGWLKNLRFMHERDGGSAVEFALMSPIFVVMFIGTVDVGLFLMERIQLHNAATAVAQYVVQTENVDELPIVAAQTYEGTIAEIDVQTDFECECDDGIVDVCPANCAAGTYERRFVSVSLAGTYAPLFSYGPFLDSFDMVASVRTRTD